LPARLHPGTLQERSRRDALPIKIVAFVTVKPGHEDEFVSAARTCVAASREEPGVLHYDLWREADGEQRFVFNELYANDAAVDAHMASDHFKALGMAARDIAAGRPVIIKTNPVDVAD
jgi:quinol monooxygenase YgiN